MNSRLRPWRRRLATLLMQPMINFDKAQGGMSWQGSLVNGERVSRADG
jgi:hypothetical protein